MISEAERNNKPCRKGHTNWALSGKTRREWRCRTCIYERQSIKRKAQRAQARANRLPNSDRPAPWDWPEGYHHHPYPRVKHVYAGYHFNDTIRDAVLNALRRDPDLSMSEIAGRCGWIHSRKTVAGDTTRVYRILGISTYVDKKARGGFNYRQLIRDADAVAIARAIHVDPWEIGL